MANNSIQKINADEIIENFFGKYPTASSRIEKIYWGYSDAVLALGNYYEVRRLMGNTPLFFDGNLEGHYLECRGGIRRIISHLQKIVKTLEEKLMELDVNKTILKNVEPFKTYYSREV